MKTTRSEAMRAIDRYYLTGKACKRGHLSKRFTVSGACTQCMYEKDAAKRRAFAQRLREKEAVA